MATELEPIDPREALEMHLQDCRGTLSPNTVQQKEYRVGFFVRWCEGADNGSNPRLTNLNNVSGRDFHRFKNWRQSHDINTVTLRANLSDLRSFMDFCVSIDAVPQEVPDKISVPVLDSGENQRETFMDYDEAQAVAEYLDTYRYATLDHVLFLLMWETGARLGGLHSLDVGDIDWDDETITFQHRPNEETRLKNGPDGERIVTLEPETMDVLHDYVTEKRVESTDEYGRRPLFSTVHGRMHRRYLPKRIYRATCPCEYGKECPSGREPSACEYTDSYDAAVECPHNTRPHDVRRGAITHWLKSEVPEKIVSDRMNVSTDTLSKHYDKRTDRERAEMRRGYLDEV